MMTSADLAGEMLIGVLVVCMVTFGPVVGSDGEAGCVRSNPVWEEWIQKSDAEPMMALRCGSVGTVEAMLIGSRDDVSLFTRMWRQA